MIRFLRRFYASFLAYNITCDLLAFIIKSKNNSRVVLVFHVNKKMPQPKKGANIFVKVTWSDSHKVPLINM